MKYCMFTPMSVTVKSGATVSRVNMDDELYTVVSDTGAIRSSGLDIACSIHPRMIATVVVE